MQNAINIHYRLAIPQAKFLSETMPDTQFTPLNSATIDDLAVMKVMLHELIKNASREIPDFAYTPGNAQQRVPMPNTCVTNWFNIQPNFFREVLGMDLGPGNHSRPHSIETKGFAGPAITFIGLGGFVSEAVLNPILEMKGAPKIYFIDFAHDPTDSYIDDAAITHIAANELQLMLDPTNRVSLGRTTWQVRYPMSNPQQFFEDSFTIPDGKGQPRTLQLQTLFANNCWRLRRVEDVIPGAPVPRPIGLLRDVLSTSHYGSYRWSELGGAGDLQVSQADASIARITRATVAYRIVSLTYPDLTNDVRFPRAILVEALQFMSVKARTAETLAHLRAHVSAQVRARKWIAQSGDPALVTTFVTCFAYTCGMSFDRACLQAYVADDWWTTLLRLFGIPTRNENYVQYNNLLTLSPYAFDRDRYLRILAASGVTIGSLYILYRLLVRKITRQLQQQQNLQGFSTLSIFEPFRRLCRFFCQVWRREPGFVEVPDGLQVIRVPVSQPHSIFFTRWYSSLSQRFLLWRLNRRIRSNLREQQPDMPEIAESFRVRDPYLGIAGPIQPILPPVPLRERSIVRDVTVRLVKWRRRLYSWWYTKQHEMLQRGEQAISDLPQEQREQARGTLQSISFVSQIPQVMLGSTLSIAVVLTRLVQPLRFLTDLLVYRGSTLINSVFF